MATGVIIVTTLIVIAAASLGIYEYRLKREDDLPMKEKPKIINFDTQHSEGYSHGNVQYIKKGLTGRKKYVYKPSDVDYDDIEQGKEIPEQEIWAENYQIQELPQGSLSSRRPTIIIHPHYPEDYPEGFKSSSFGKAMQEALTERKAESTSIGLMRKERELQDDMLQEKNIDLFAGLMKTSKKAHEDFAKNTLHAMNPKSNKDSSQGNFDTSGVQGQR